MTPYNITHCKNGHLIFEQVAGLRDKPETLLLQLSESGEKLIPTLYLPVDALENWKEHHDLIVPEIPYGHKDLRLTFLLSDTGSQQFAIVIFAGGSRALMVPVTPLQMLIPPRNIRTRAGEIIPILHHSNRVYIVPDAPVSWRMSRTDGVYFGFREQSENGVRQLIFDVGSPMFRPAMINGVTSKRTSREHGDRRASGETSLSVKSPKNPYSLVNYPGDGIGRWLAELGESMAYGIVLGVPTAFLPNNALGPWRDQMALSLPSVPTTGDIELAYIVSGQQFFAFLMFGGMHNNKIEKRSMAILLRITPLQMLVSPRAIKTHDGCLHPIKTFWDKVFNISVDGTINQRMQLGVDGGQSGIVVGMENVMTCTVASAFMRTAVVQSW
jgi:hypothetical protein